MSEIANNPAFYQSLGSFLDGTIRMAQLGDTSQKMATALGGTEGPSPFAAYNQFRISQEVADSINLVNELLERSGGIEIDYGLKDGTRLYGKLESVLSLFDDEDTCHFVVQPKVPGLKVQLSIPVNEIHELFTPPPEK